MLYTSATPRGRTHGETTGILGPTKVVVVVGEQIRAERESRAGAELVNSVLMAHLTVSIWI